MKLGYLFIVITIFLIALAGCSTPAANSEDENKIPSPVQPIVDQAAEATPTKPAPENTQIPSPQPSPTATQVPLPELIDNDTVKDIQVVRSFMLYDEKLSNLMKSSISPDKRLLAAWGCTYQEGSNGVCESPLILLFDLDTGKVIHQLEPLTTVVSDFKFSPDGKVLAISGCHTPIAYYGQNDTICDAPRVWLVDTETGQLIHELKKYNSPVESMVFSPDGKTLYTGIFYFKKYSFTDSTIRAWDVSSGSEIRDIQPDIENCDTVLLNMTRDGRYLITQYNNKCSGKRTTKWWDLENPSTRAVSGYQGIFSVVSPDSTKIAVMESFENLVIHIYDLTSGKRIQTIPTGLRKSSSWNFGFTPDSQSLLYTDSKSDKGEGYAIINIESGDLTTRVKPASFEMLPDAAFSFSPDGKLLFVFGRLGDWQTQTGDYDPKFSVWDTKTWTEISVLQPYFSLFPWDNAFTVSMTPDQKRLVVTHNSDIAQFGLPVQEMAPAREFLIDYLDKLSNGKYLDASNNLKYSDDSIIAEWLSGQLPGVKPEDKTAVLETLCTDERFPCQKLLNVTFEAQTLPDTYLFRVQFANPDGTPVVWPPCHDLPKDKYCDFRTEFDYTVQMQPDGTFKILDTLPYSLWLDQ
jgi:WD40 repeat protein